MSKVAVITGGSRGIGKACAIELAKQGYDIAITYVGNDDAAKATVKELQSFNIKAKSYKFNIADNKACQDTVEEIHKDFERIDVLLNNAGITRDGFLIRMTSENWNDVINTNLNSAYNMCCPVSKIMMKQREGCIINMSSIVGIVGNACQTNYAAAKAGLIGFTKSLAKELGSRNIRVNAIAPGFVKTDMTKNLDAEKITSIIPLKRLGEPEDIAKTVKFLACDTTYITGQVIGVDGGMMF